MLAIFAVFALTGTAFTRRDKPGDDAKFLLLHVEIAAAGLVCSVD